MLTIRLRSRDGLERVQVPEDSSLGALRAAVAGKVERPVERVHLSCDKDLLRSKHPETFLDLSEDDSTSLLSLGFKNGEMVYCAYEGERAVDPGYQRSAFESRSFGAHMDVQRLLAKQVRMERQEKAAIAATSFDSFAAHAFQAYIQSALDFSIKRCGILYGRLEGDIVLVDAIYEPEQQGKTERMAWVTDSAQAQAADKLAGMLGLKKVGLIFNQSAGEKEYIMNDEELWQACAMQAEVGEHAVIAVFSQVEEDGQKEIHLEAFQCSKQAVQLWSDGWIVEPASEGDVSSVSSMRNPQDVSVALPVMIAGKDVAEVDNDFFLVPVAVRDHEAPLLTSFAIENRLTGQANTDLREHLARHAQKSWPQRLADFHLLLWLGTSSGLDLDGDVTQIVESVRAGAPVMEGYTMLIESLAGG